MATTFLGFGNGSDGAGSLSGTWSPTKTSCSGSGTALTVSSTSGFSANDIVLVHQSRGTGVGLWELAQISSVGSGLTLVNSLTNTYTDSGASQAQVIKVPQYSSLTFSGTFTVPAWDGDTGGIFVAMVAGQCTIPQTFNLSGVGYRGGTGGLAPTETSDTGDTGESSAGASIAGGSSSPGGTPSPANSANGAAGVGAQGQRVPDGAAGGGGASHGNAGTAGSSFGGASISGGAAGSTDGQSDLTGKILFGAGGGGGGKSKDPNSIRGGGAGGDGGGIAIIYANEFVATATVSVAGENGSNGGLDSAPNTDSEGGGGAGAGGSFLLFSTNATLGSNLLTAAGGVGGSGRPSSGGDGGNGGDGRIQLECCTISGTIDSSTYGSLTNSTGGQTFCQGLFAGMV